MKNDTIIHHYSTALITKATPKTPDLIHRAGVAAGLGAFYDALLAKGIEPEVAHDLLWAAYERLPS